MNTFKNYLPKQYEWYSQNTPKVVFIVGLHFISSYIVALPYINIFTSLFSLLPYFVDWIAILILFKPKKEKILKVGLLLFLVAFLFHLTKLNFMLEIIGQASFFAIGTYVVLALRELKNK